MPYLLFIVVMAFIALHYPRLMDAIVYLAIAPFLGLVTGGFFWGLFGLFFPGIVSFAGFGTFVAMGTILVVVGLLTIRTS